MAFRTIIKTAICFLLPIAVAFGAASSIPPSYKVGVIQTIEHPALDKTRQGTLDELIAQGFKENLQWTWESAQMNQALAMQIAQKFVGQGVDLIVAIGTPAAQAALSATRNSTIPVIFSSVTDPKSAKLMGNIAGVSNYVSVSYHFDLISQILPGKKRIGIIYNVGDVNSVTLVDQMRTVAREKGFEELELATVAKTSEVSAATDNLIGKKVDAIFINNDNTALAAFDGIAKICSLNKMPLFASDADVLEKGALAVRGPDQYDLGRQTGRMVAKVLRKEARAEDLGTELPEKVEIYLNEERAKALGIVFSQDVKKSGEKS